MRNIEVTSIIVRSFKNPHRCDRKFSADPFIRTSNARIFWANHQNLHPTDVISVIGELDRGCQRSNTEVLLQAIDVCGGQKVCEGSDKLCSGFAVCSRLQCTESTETIIIDLVWVLYLECCIGPLSNALGRRQLKALNARIGISQRFCDI